MTEFALPLDIPTLAFTRALMQLMLGGLLLYIGTRDLESQGARWWAAGFLLNGLSLLMFAITVPASWEPATTVVNHLALAASSICLLCGFWTFAGQRHQPWVLALMVGLPLISLIAFEWIWPTARWRILMTATSQTIFLLALQQSLAHPHRPELAVMTRRLRYVVLAFLLIQLWSYGSLASVLPTGARVPPDYHRLIFTISSLLFMLSLAVGCLALQFGLMAARNADLAYTDWLTGLPNRRGFFHRLQQLAGDPEGEPTSVIAIDIDHFKQVNDTYGHATGDRVLKALGALLQGHAGPRLLPARLGGEEFCVVGVGHDLATAAAQAEALRKALQQLKVPTSTGTISVTLSAGVHQVARGQSLEQALAQADEALYRAKREGRNRVATSADAAAACARSSAMSTFSAPHGRAETHCRPCRRKEYVPPASES